MKRNAQKDITRCICDFNPGIGDFICCDKCSVWQHMKCMGVHPSRVPQIYECELCSPRPVDKEAAVQLQLLLRDEESTDSDDGSPPVQQTNHRKSTAKRSRKPSSNSVKSEESANDHDDRRTYKDVKENMYSPSIKHRLEPRTEGLPSFGTSPPGVARIQPQAGYSPVHVGYPAMLHVVNHGPSKILITRQTVRPGNFISDFMGHFKQLSEFYEEIGGKSTLFKRPLNYVLHYPQLDICVDTRDYGNISRFVRRSCHPNAQVKSYLNEGKLHIGIYAKELITSNSEITIAFNFPVKDYQFTQICSCSSVGCLVAKNNEYLASINSTKTFRRTESMESMNSDDDHRKHKLTREEVKMQSYIQAIEKIERDEERKRVLSENLKSPVREHDNESGSNTPSRGAGKGRRRKGSGKKVRKASGSSQNNTANTKSPEHFTFDPGVNNSANNSPECSPCPRPPANSGPAYNITEPILSKHHVKYNGYAHDIHLRPINTTPFSKLRRDFKLKTTNTLTPIKMQKDGFIVPIHGSLLTPKVRNTIPAYKTTKKRWLENFIQEGVSNAPKSPNLSPRQALSPSRDPAQSSPSKDPASTAAVGVEETLTAATRTLQLSDHTSQSTDHASLPDEPMETSLVESSRSDVGSTCNELTLQSICNTPVPSASTQFPDNDVIQAAPITPTTPPAPVTPTVPNTEKKKKVSLADYRKRLQSRTSRPSNNSICSDGICESKSDKENSPRSRPVFEPISPEDPEKFASGLHQPSLLEEFTRPSLSETISLDSLHPRKIRKIEFPESTIEQMTQNNDMSNSEATSILSKQVASYCNPAPYCSPAPLPTPTSLVPNNRPYEPSGKSIYNPPSNGIVVNHIAKSQNNSPSHGLSDDTFSKIKEILSQSNPGLVSSNNLNVSSPIVKTNHTMYDPNATSLKNYPFPNHYSDEMYSRDTKRLKSSLGANSEYTSKYYKDTDQR